MTRFDADTPENRRALIADAIAAHRSRGSQFCTLQAHRPPAGKRAGDGAEAEEPPASDHSTDSTGEQSPDTLAASEQSAWIQFSDPEGVLNLDCTDAEYERLVDALAVFPEFSVVEQSAPEDADGRNLRIQARGDAERIADCVETLFVEGYGYDADFRLWATEL